ncbi:MAG: uroporphyrinogen-III C-methyltransferase, partial [Planctomycetota bacterium]
MSEGRVYLVGAGPGDPGLLTLRGRDLVARADVVVYDYLSSPRLLDWVRPDAEQIYVGKQAGAHTLSQDQINELLVSKAGAGAAVVRLKGGDSFVFGRGGEEALALVEAGIDFEVVPGVTAGVAAAAYAGIPVTHRKVAASLALVTGHEAPGKSESDLDFEALARWKGTLAFYMGVRNLD